MRHFMNDSRETVQAGADALDAYIDRIKYLPPTPTLMLQLIELFRRPDADVDEIVTLLRRDPALSAEVLRRCNSTFFAGDEAVLDISEAVFRIGFYEIYQMTVGMCGMRTMTTRERLPGFPAEELRRHSSITAIAAGTLAETVGVSEGIAFTAGLLHDLGKLVLALAERDKYVSVIHDSRRTGSPISVSEKQSFGFNHNEVGARLLRRWGVPEEIASPVQAHNATETKDELQRFAVIINLSSHLANYLEEETAAGPFLESPEVKPLMDSLGLNDEQVLAWEPQVRKKVKELPTLKKA